MKKKLITIAALIALAIVPGCGVTNSTNWDPSIRVQSGTDADAPAGKFIPKPAP